MRYDLVRPRKLRPAPPKRPKPPQPALVVVVPDLLSKADVELYKAIRGHVEALNKTFEGRKQAEAWERFEAPKHEGSMPTGVHEMSKFWSKWEGPKYNPEARRQRIDVSTPEHDHARLMAKRAYLMDKIQGHVNAGHSPDNPVLQQRKKVLGQVSQKLRSYENRGISSGPEHHSDWQKHYAQNYAGKYSPEHTDAGVTYHGRAAYQPSAEQKELHQKMAVPGPMHAPVESHMDVTGTFHPASAFAKPTKQASPAKPTAAAGTAVAKVSAKPKTGPKGTAVVETPHLSKGQKSDEWISNKIRLLMHEGKPQDQAIAIAYSMAGRARKSDLSDSDVEKGDQKSDDWVSNKIRLLMHEGKPQDQAVAIAYNMAGRARKSVPLFLSV